MEDRLAGPLFDLDSPFNDPVRHTLFSMVRRPLAKVLRLDTLNTLYSTLQDGEGGSFVDKALDLLGVRFSVDGQPVSRVPRTGPLVAVCNHPFGVLEGLLLVRILREVRSDIKIMANFMLGMIPEMDDLIIQVDPFGGAESSRKNIAGLKACMRWLKDGGMLVVFPAGEVSSLKVKKRRVGDPNWSPMIGRIIRKTGAAALPVFFNGRNSGLFQTLGLIHPRLRTVLLPHENLKHASRDVIGVRFGTVIGHDKLAEHGDDQAIVDYLRFRTYLLRRERKPRFNFKPRETRRSMDPIANSRGKHILASEVAALPDDNILLESSDFTVFHAQAFMIPRLLREIGIQREETFRQVGEGTGRAMDIDRFDDTYHHLVLWNRKEREVAGAYRFARTDEIIAEQGASGLYTSTLFDYRPGFLEGLGPALELGRSFVIPKYQRSYQPLLMLWKGLAEYVVRNPRYSRLFGCVSISSEYSVIARELIVGFMERHCSMPELARMALPKRPPKVKKLKRLDFSLPEAVFDDPEDVADFVRDVEDGRSIPVLLKQYLKLGGKIIGFNMDPDFGNCMDGLILVDLHKSDPKVLSRFMGREGTTRFQNAGQPAPVRRIGDAAA
ncbi:GNAT family N-acetyltransferase [Pseudodesulfovibrio thermohalotolerans]|uniref:lysophospholipid acyltransferase family protein n=1 Tax=Pseudodesulfovibrio thermohalotolerans TaxID=2880651 RepID=UPI0024428622|nr:GNAT family N-acyltransferase [Pseudodesulfovibrio thermohalotolerans]WFS63508.1 GNAT family N-acetyltransferase [Pseudodesulfovibrio thermohalotolerans]